MRAERETNQGKPIAKIRLIVLALVLTLIIFGIIGALVTLMTQTKKPQATERKGNFPQARQIDRETFQKDTLVPGS